MIVDVTITVFCERVQRGCTFGARMYDRASGTFFSGTGETALEAVAWCLDDYVRRFVRGEAHRMSTRADARPGEFAIGGAL